MLTLPTPMTSSSAVTISPDMIPVPGEAVPDASQPAADKSGQMSRRFPETRWDRVLAAQQEDVKAREELARAYWQPLYHFALREWRLDHHRAQELVGNFFVERFWKCIHGKEVNPNAEESGDRSTKLRTYLLKAFTHAFSNEWRRARSVRHGSGAIHESLDDPEAGSDHQSLAGEASLDGGALAAYDYDWALNVWERSVEALYQRTAQRGSSERFTTLSAHGVITRDPAKLREPDYAALAAALTEPETTVRQIVSRLRRDLRTLVHEEVRQTLHESLNLEEEYGYITQLLFHGGSSGNGQAD